MAILKAVKGLLADILDIDEQEMTPETYIIRELGAESIDLLELAVSMNARFRIEVRDDEIFLSRLRAYVIDAAAQGRDTVQYLAEKLPFLPKERVKELVSDMEGGPTLKVKDLVSYVEWKQQNG